MIWSPKALPALLAAGALLLGATACADESAEPAAQGTDELSISATGVDSLPFMAILQAGIDKGWFEEEGLKVDLYSGGGGGNTMRVVTSGDADMAIAGNTSVLLAAKQADSNLKVVAPWFQVNDFSWISPPGRTIEGATLGFSSAGSSTELVVKALEKKLGVKAQAVGPMGDNWTAAKAGQITAGWAMQPFIADKQATDNAEVLVKSRDVIGDMPADLVAVNGDYAEANGENLTAFFRVADRLNKWVVENPDEAGAELGPLVGVSPQVMTDALRNTPDIEKGYSLTVDPAGLKNLSDLMVAAGQISEPVDWATVLDQQYLPEDARTEF
ncbi:ABC transporter substrate-binding protein [Mycolicibacterium baixiangningiae]|uniref:ABC transporter substrate-binding protein n=1 Tax=Mycolicibacterium baixiangningiae TaxID=2761578 RepID=UPI001868BAF5|nr:ABC transporter substrate-binding protein [Mycolicibacterium baixiangningiae]